MGENRKFKVMKDMRVSILFLGQKVVKSDTIIELENIGMINGFESYLCISNNFLITDLKFLLSTGYLEEILPDKKPNLTESENPYGRQIYIAEAIHALANHDVLIKDKYGYIWDYDKIDETFYTYDDDNKDTIIITDKYTLKEILEFQFDVVPKPVEEVKEKWIKVQTNSELCSCIIKGKTIKAQGFVYKPEDLKASVLIDAIFDEIKHGGVWYLEE